MMSYLLLPGPQILIYFHSHLRSDWNENINSLNLHNDLTLSPTSAMVKQIEMAVNQRL